MKRKSLYVESDIDEAEIIVEQMKSRSALEQGRFDLEKRRMNLEQTGDKPIEARL